VVALWKLDGRRRTAVIAAGLVGGLLVLILALRGSGGESAGLHAAATPAPVHAALVEARDMPVTLFEVGTVEAEATVAIKSRVDGVVAAVAFTEGASVAAGDVLFRLDDRLARANLAQGQANLARDRAGLADARSALERARTLAARDFATRAALDTAMAKVASLAAGVEFDLAQITGLETTLDYTVIRAPISGRTGAAAVKLGASIKANDVQPIVTINQTRPVQVVFQIPQAKLPALRAAMARGEVPVEATLHGASAVKALGKLAFIENAVDQATGTVAARATFANEDETLWPGSFVDVLATLETRHNIAAVPAEVVMIGQDGPYAFVIGPDSKVEVRKLKVEQTTGPVAFVREGLKAGEQVVTEGQLRLTAGAAVAVQPTAAPATPGT